MASHAQESKPMTKPFTRHIMHQSVPNAIPSPGQMPGEFFEEVKSKAPGKNFSAKAWPLSQKKHLPQKCFTRSSQPVDRH